MLRLYAVFLALSITACSSVKSSLSYTQGTQALEAGDYQAAVMHLEEAVRLDPGLSKNHNNLASAYLATGRIDASWREVREAILLDPSNKFAWSNQRVIFARLKKEKNLAEGDSEPEIVEKLGEPDGRSDASQSECNCFWWQYGSIAISVEDNKLSGIDDMDFRSK